MTSLLTGGVNAAFLGVDQIEPHLDLYITKLGFEVHRSGVVTATEASALWGEGLGEIPYTELRAAGAGSGRIFLLEVAGREVGAHPMQADTGLLAINMYTRDLDVSYDVLASSGENFRTPPASWAVPLGEKLVTVTQSFLLAPDGVDIVFVQPAEARGTAAWDADPERHYTELTSVVCHVPDFEAEARFWGAEGLGMSQWYDVTFSHPGLDAMAQLPDGSVMRLAFMAGDTTARLEITRLEDRTLGVDHRAVQRTGRHLGHTGWLFTVPDVEAVVAAARAAGGEVLSDVHAGPSDLFGGARVAFVNTPNGLPVTFVESLPTS